MQSENFRDEMMPELRFEGYVPVGQEEWERGIAGGRGEDAESVKQD